MVFSQTSHKTQSVLKVVEIDRLKKEKHQENGLTGVITDGFTALPPPCSFIEEYLKPEPVFETTMYHETDSEFFQDLVGWCSDPAKEEQVQTIDSHKVTEDRAYITDTLHNSFSPQGWDGFDVNSPAAQASFYTTTPQDPLSPAECAAGLDAKFPYGLGLEGAALQEQFLDISSLPVVLGDRAEAQWAAPFAWETDYTKPITIHNTVPFIDEDSLDMKYLRSVTPREVERPPARAPLSLDVLARAPASTHVISTPEVLTYVEQLEREKCSLAALIKAPTHTEPFAPPMAAPAREYSPVTPKSEAREYSPVTPTSSAQESGDERPRRRRRRSDSDETYSPRAARAAPRKYKKRKPNIPIKDMILALEGSQTTRARRGRPPKRRDSAVSSACSVDDHSTVSTHEGKYRELRDKNNEASKRSRMHRKLKELQMEQMADELEEQNKKLKVKADILEDMTKRLKDALMKSILQK